MQVKRSDPKRTSWLDRRFFLEIGYQADRASSRRSGSADSADRCGVAGYDRGGPPFQGRSGHCAGGRQRGARQRAQLHGCAHRGAHGGDHPGQGREASRHGRHLRPLYLHGQGDLRRCGAADAAPVHAPRQHAHHPSERRARGAGSLLRGTRADAGRAPEYRSSPASPPT
jgi:hypothetical protein